MTTVRGPTAAVIEERRPVTLENLFLIGDRTAERLHLLPTLVDGRPNPEAHRLDGEAVRGFRGPRPGGARRKLYTPARLEVLDRLEEASMLPAIYFIFSRNGCDEAARSTTAAGVRLTTGDERDRIREIVDDRVAGIDDRDLAVLGYGPFLAGLEAGVAAHHAGMVPPFKEAVEACFTEGLVKIVFATETLAVGINMPARTVVIEKLSKFTGDHHEFLTPGDYTQLTGRAGRRGIDERGLRRGPVEPLRPLRPGVGAGFEPFVPAQLGLPPDLQHDGQPRPLLHAARRRTTCSTCPSRSTRPTATWCAWRPGSNDVRPSSTSCASRPSAPTATSTSTGACARARLGARRERGRHRARADAACARATSSRSTAAGWAGGRRSSPSARRKGAMKVAGAEHRQGSRRHLRRSDFDEAPRPLGRIELPTPFAPNRQQFQRQVARTAGEGAGRRRPKHRRSRPTAERGRARGGPSRHRRSAPAGPTAGRRPGRPGRSRGRGPADTDRGPQPVRIAPIRSGAADPRVLGLRRGWSLTDRRTPAGRLLPRVRPARGRGDAPGPPRRTRAGRRWPGWPRCSATSTAARSRRRCRGSRPGRSASAGRPIESLARELRQAEEDAGLPADPGSRPDLRRHRPRDGPSGQSFATVVEDEELSGGDFVRTMKQLIDLLRQLALLAFEDDTRESARRGCRPPVPGRRGGVDRHRSGGRRRGRPRGGRGRRGRAALARAVTIRRGQDWGAPRPAAGRPARGGRRRGRRRRGDPLAPGGRAHAADRFAQRRPLPDAGGRVGRAAPRGGDRRVHRGPRCGRARRSGPLVREPPRGQAVLVAGRGRGRHERAVPRRRGTSPRGAIPTTVASTWCGPPIYRWHDRWKAWRRLPGGTYLPHPGIDVRSVPALELDLRRRLTVRLDGRVVGEADRLALRVEPDASPCASERDRDAP